MLAYLLDENISSVIAEQISRKNPQVSVQSVFRWRGGAFIGQSDGRLFRTAAQEGLTLVTYDLRTIPALLSEMAADGENHAGVVFVDDASIRGSDFGGLVTALLSHWHLHSAQEWHNRVGFLTESKLDEQ